MRDALTGCCAVAPLDQRNTQLSGGSGATGAQRLRNRDTGTARKTSIVPATLHATAAQPAPETSATAAQPVPFGRATGAQPSRVALLRCPIERNTQQPAVYRYRLTDNPGQWLTFIAPGMDLTAAADCLAKFCGARLIEVQPR